MAMREALQSERLTLWLLGPANIDVVHPLFSGSGHTVGDGLISDPASTLAWLERRRRLHAESGLAWYGLWDRDGNFVGALIERGHHVVLLDASAALLRIARSRCPTAPALVSDPCNPALSGPVDGVIARGVLNDLLTDPERALALRAFARLTRDAGALVLDVREATASQERATGTWRTIDADLADGSRLRFASRPTWNNGRIVVDERYEITRDDGEVLAVSEYRFEMRPWSRDEMQQLLTEAGYERIEMRAGAGRRTPDRLLVTARR